MLAVSFVQQSAVEQGEADIPGASVPFSGYTPHLPKAPSCLTSSLSHQV